ncbi:putative GCN5-related N-acetyltransferase [uncultured Paludibacter sp.]|uniref:Putative GCN5-related N-acetyltransferase n=1 Tax=uncultured Paludibacter sp. TaxID=497635 RepID=A0A653AKC6_9BACT|nr:putative GCN5-related N-acetyltransferase [uncultured Paludibacter sp.]
MEFIQIKSSEDKFFDKILKLYQEAFPENQRHTNADFKKLIESGKNNFYCNAVLLNGFFVGFFNHWIFDKFIFAEHFAIEEAVRGNKIGEKVMKMIESTAELPLVFEVELPDTEINARRIEFYHRLGYEIVPIEYLQPPYNKNGYPQPLHLMTDNLEFVLDNYEFIKTTIYKNVYRVK